MQFQYHNLPITITGVPSQKGRGRAIGSRFRICEKQTRRAPTVPLSLTQRALNQRRKKKIKKRQKNSCVKEKKGCIFAAAKNGNVGRQKSSLDLFIRLIWKGEKKLSQKSAKHL